MRACSANTYEIKKFKAVKIASTEILRQKYGMIGMIRGNSEDVDIPKLEWARGRMEGDETGSVLVAVW